MKVLFITRSHIGLGRGGIQLKIRRTAESLRQQGVDVILFDPWKNQIPEVDVCHFFSADGGMHPYFVRAKEEKKPVVISPTFGGVDVPLWKTMLMARLSRRIPGFCVSVKNLGQILAGADRIFPLHETECYRLTKTFGVKREKMMIVPNGIDKCFANGDPAVFRERMGFSDVVLHVGSIDPNKNQLAMVRAMKGLPFNYVSIGGFLIGNKDYEQKCRDEAGDNVHFLGQLDYDDPLLASAYANARVSVLPSYSEVMPSALYQAAQAGCRLIVSSNLTVTNELSPYVNFVDPDGIDKIREVIREQMNKPLGQEDEQRREVALTMPDWSDIAGTLRSVYLELI